jgi:hypothetical protein
MDEEHPRMPEHDATSAREWETALDQLEVRLNRAERMASIADADLELRLPAALNTIPRYLLERAGSLVERHQRLVAQLPERAERVTEAFTLHDRVGHLVTGPREPVSADFLDALQVDEA